MNAKELLARDLNAMLVNGSAGIVSTGVKITQKKDVSVLVWSNRKPYGDIDTVIDSWHGTTTENRITEIVNGFKRMYHTSEFGFDYRIEIKYR